MVTGVVGPTGGILGSGVHSINIPPGAVPSPTAFMVSVPASGIAEVEVTAVGIGHFLFNRPVTITIGFEGCSGAEDSASLAVWYVAPVTKQKLERMGGVVDPVARTITFTTGHLSGYAIAN